MLVVVEIPRHGRRCWHSLGGAGRRPLGRGHRPSNPDIVIIQPYLAQLIATPEATDPPDPYNWEKWAAIMEFDGGLNQEAVERAVSRVNDFHLEAGKHRSASAGERHSNHLQVNRRNFLT